MRFEFLDLKGQKKPLSKQNYWADSQNKSVNAFVKMMIVENHREIVRSVKYPDMQKKLCKLSKTTFACFTFQHLWLFCNVFQSCQKVWSNFLHVITGECCKTYTLQNIYNQWKRKNAYFCLVLLQVPKCFVPVQIFWASPRDSNKGVATAQDVSWFFCEYLPWYF